MEVSGTVAEVGVDVPNWAIGDPCVALLAGGGYAEYVAAPAGQVVPPPLGVELVAAAGVIEVAATVYSNIELVGLAMGDQFLVHGGAGGIGSFAIQYAKSLGATVIATAGTEDKLNYCRSIGADRKFAGERQTGAVEPEAAIVCFEDDEPTLNQCFARNSKVRRRASSALALSYEPRWSQLKPCPAA